MIRSIKGFTLLELMIALFILTIIGVMISAGLNTTLNTQQRIEQKFSELADIQLAMVTLERDVQQFNKPPAVENEGQKTKIQALTISATGVEFYRAGLFDPKTKTATAKMKKVSYQLEGDSLVRTIQNYNGSDPSGNPEKETLLKNVSSIQVALLPKKTNLTPTTGAQAPPQPSRKALLVELNVKNLGYVKRVILFPIDPLDEQQEIQNAAQTTLQ